MQIAFYQVDAFTSQVFSGNPAVVCILEHWPEDKLLQQIAAENNLPETAFLIPGADGSYQLRWFTPTLEVDLCGHATLASAYVVLNALEPAVDTVHFDTRSGPLAVRQDSSRRLVMDFPARPPQRIDASAAVAEALGAEPLELWQSRDLMAVFDAEATVRQLSPHRDRLLRLREAKNVIVTAPGSDCDFVSRYFAPGAGIDEDPVTGSTHCTLIPYWSSRLGRTELIARQLSPRGGTVFGSHQLDRVVLRGHAVCFASGFIAV